MQVDMKNRWTGVVLFSGEMSSFKLVVEAAVKARADLSKADMVGAILWGANLSKANLSKAGLSWVRLIRGEPVGD